MTLGWKCLQVKEFERMRPTAIQMIFPLIEYELGFFIEYRTDGKL